MFGTNGQLSFRHSNQTFSAVPYQLAGGTQL
jgi:hypothetical protein